MQSETRLLVPRFPTGRHAMRIGDGRDGNSACRKRRTTLDIARWRGNDARASRRSPSEGLRRRAGCGGTPGVDMDDRRFVEVGCRGRLHRGRRGRRCRGGRRGRLHRGRLQGGAVDVCRVDVGRSVVKPGGGDRDAGVPGARTEATDDRGTVKPGGGGLDACVPRPGTGGTDGTG